MKYEVRVTLELLESDDIMPEVDEELLISGVQDGELDPGFVGDIETALDELVRKATCATI